jgi:hypothetical protein
MSGTINLSLSQQFDNTGKPLSGGRLSFFQAATTTPQNAYKDTALTLPHPNPIILDSSGRVPEFWLADGNIKFVLTDKSGVVQISSTSTQILGPSSGSGGGSTVDSTTIFQTGDLMWLDQSGTRAGWVRDNGRTIGSATSGASERANADCEALFTFLWTTYSDSICPVVGGRGANAAADWAANKQITLPDKRGYVPGGLDDMGNSAAGRLANVPLILGTVTAAGSLIGETTHQLTVSELAKHPHTLHDPGHPHVTQFGSLTQLGGGGNVGLTGPGSNVNVASETAETGITIDTAGGDIAHNNVQRTVLGTFFRKL